MLITQDLQYPFDLHRKLFMNVLATSLETDKVSANFSGPETEQWWTFPQ